MHFDHPGITPHGVRLLEIAPLPLRRRALWSVRLGVLGCSELSAQDTSVQNKALANAKDMNDKMEIDTLVASFFNVFNNEGGKNPSLDRLYELCLSECRIIKTCGVEPEIYSLTEFIAPRKRLLTSGELVGFSEWESAERTDIFGDIAQRFSTYEKSGELAGKKFSARGMKTFQLIRTAVGWKIISVAWDDERPGLSIPAD